MQRRVIHLIALSWLVCATGAADAQTERRIALLIGNQDYKAGVGALKNPINDINLVGSALKKVGFKVLKPVENATRTQILLAINDFADQLKNADEGAIGFVYYSGHGVASAGENYIIPIDVAKPSTRLLRVQGVKQSEILSILQTEAPNAAHYLVLDACRNNLQGRRGGKGFLPVRQRSGVLIAYAAEPGKTASDDGVKSGPYAAALARELVKSGQSDLIMFHRVRVAVSKATGGDQVPWTEDGIIREKRFRFGGASVDTTPNSDNSESNPTSSFDARALDLTFWKDISASTDPADFEDYLRRFPDGVFVGRANRKLKQLEAKETQVAVAISQAPASPDCDDVTVRLASGDRACVKPGSGESFKDCPNCPEMVVVPAGSFMMGSNYGSNIEKPVRRVTIAKPFAVGKHEVTFTEWDACVADGGCKHKPGSEGWGRGKQPVINVSWDDITKQYLPWLSRKSGKTYRLPSEAEWEYAARAGTTTAYPWGAKASHEKANYGKDGCCGGLAKGSDRWVNTAPVGKFPANAFGLHDLHGNVMEWVQDCYKDSYSGAPTDGSAVTTGNCGRVYRGGRVLRGGYWSSNHPSNLRSASRHWQYRIYRYDYGGFRVVRMLTP